LVRLPIFSIHSLTTEGYGGLSALMVT